MRGWVTGLPQPFGTATLKILTQSQRDILRRFLALMLACSMAACAHPLTHVDPETIIGGVDFRAHSRKGFLFTPNAYPGEFEAVGMVTVTMYAEANASRSGPNGSNWVWEYSALAPQDALTEIRKRATALGADAISNTTLRAVTRTVGGAAIPGIEVSGFAIKRSKP